MMSSDKSVTFIDSWWLKSFLIGTGDTGACDTSQSHWASENPQRTWVDSDRYFLEGLEAAENVLGVKSSDMYCDE